jgi:hypothetical protein
MLVINADLKGNKRETERIIVYTHGLNKERTISSSGFHELSDRVFGENPITGNMERLRAFALSTPLSKPDAIRLLDELKNDPKYERVGLRILQRETYHIYAEGKRADLNDLPQQFTIGGSKNLSARGWIKRFLNLPFSTLQKVETISGDKYFVTEKLRLDEFLRLHTISWDTEYMHWWDAVSIDELANSENELKEFLKMQPEHQNSNFKSKSKNELVKMIEEHFNRHCKDPKLNYHEQIMTSQIGQLIDGNRVVDYHEHLSGSETKFSLELSIGDVIVRNHRSNTSNEMTINMQNTFDSIPFIILLTQNGMSYDCLNTSKYVTSELKKIKEEEKERRKKSVDEENDINPKSENSLKPFSIHDRAPKIESSAAFYKKVILPIIHVDFAPYSQYNLPFTQDNKLETIFSLILGREIRKTESYDDLKRLTIEQIISNSVSSNTGEKSADKLRSYGIADSITLIEAAKYILTQVYFKARLFKRNPEEICCTTKSFLALKDYEYEHVIQTLKPIGWNNKQREAYDNLSASEEFAKMLPEEILKIINKSTQIGLNEGALIYFAPYTRIYSRMLNQNKVVREIFEYIINLNISPDEFSTQKTLTRFDLIHSIEEGYLLPHIFESSLRKYKDPEIEKVIKQFSELIREYNPINHSDNFYLFDEETIDNPEFKKALRGIGFLISRGRTVSFEKGKFFLYDGINKYKRGCDIKGNLGFKTTYQRNMIKDIIEYTIGNQPIQAIEYMRDFVQQLKQGLVDREKLLHVKESVGRDFFNYSAPAQRQIMVQAFIESEMYKGDTFAKALLHNGWKTSEEFMQMSDTELFSKQNIEFLLSAYLGPRTRKGRSLSEGKVGRYLVPIVAGLDLKQVLNYIESDKTNLSFNPETFNRQASQLELIL